MPVAYIFLYQSSFVQHDPDLQQLLEVKLDPVLCDLPSVHQFVDLQQPYTQASPHKIPSPKKTERETRKSAHASPRLERVQLAKLPRADEMMIERVAYLCGILFRLATAPEASILERLDGKTSFGRGRASVGSFVLIVRGLDTVVRMSDLRCQQVCRKVVAYDALLLSHLEA
jgi:hypothetical protein